MTKPISFSRLGEFKGSCRLAASRALSPGVARALDYISHNHGSIDQLEDISGDLKVRYNTLRQTFRRETGVTLLTFLAMVRVEESLRLMEESRLLLKEIAWRVGFEHEGRMTRTFLRLTGQTPQYLRARKRLTRLTRQTLTRSSPLTGQKQRSNMNVNNEY